MDALDTHTDGATERLTVKLHDRLCLHPRQEAQTLGHTPSPGPQYADTSKRAQISRASSLSTTLWTTGRSSGRRGATALEEADRTALEIAYRPRHVTAQGSSEPLTCAGPRWSLWTQARRMASRRSA